MNEKELLNQAKTGNPEAFEKLLFIYEKPIYNYLYRLTGRREDAEDLTQKTFIKLYKSLHLINPDKSFKSWLYKIAANTAYDWFRKKKRLREIALPEDNCLNETIEPDPAYYRIEAGYDLGKALSAIKPAYKSILLLYYKDCLSYEEIADSLSLPVNTVKTHLRRAKQELKNELMIA